MADKYASPITPRLFFFLAVAILFFYGISHYNHRDKAKGHDTHATEHHDEGHDSAHH